MTAPRRNAWPKPGAGGHSRVDLAWSQALAHPVRVEILRALLEDEPGTPTRFAETLEIPLGVASHHVRRLRDLQLIRIARRTHRRGAVQHHYRLLDRTATARALWRWGLAPDDPTRPDALDPLDRGGRHATMERVVSELRRRCEQQGISQAALAERAGITPDYLSRIERGGADPRMSVLLALAAGLDTTLRELLDDAEAQAAA
jgi:DNA-binding transcriptional ArsR family regulator/DNA-binding XRE family transcriptional regulator